MAYILNLRDVFCTTSRKQRRNEVENWKSTGYLSNFGTVDNTNKIYKITIKHEAHFFLCKRLPPNCNKTVINDRLD